MKRFDSYAFRVLEDLRRVLDNHGYVDNTKISLKTGGAAHKAKSKSTRKDPATFRAKAIE